MTRTESSAVPSPLARPAAGYIPTLDGWRAVAIAGVMLFHGGPIAPAHPILTRFQNLGVSGVELFFAISGLLICSRLMDEEAANGNISLRNFYLRRLFRIQPAAFVYLAVVAILAASGFIHFSAPGWLTSLFSVRNLYRSTDPADGAVYTGHFWSLAVEEHFYLVMPCLLILLRGRRRVFGFGCIAVVALVLDEIMNRTAIAKMVIESEFALCWLFLAAWLALLLRLPHYRERFRRFLPVWPTFLTVCFLAVGMALRFKVVEHFWIPSFPLLILSTVLHPASWLSRALEWAPMRVLGRISYSLYLWQQLFCLRLQMYPEARWPLGWMQHHPQSYVMPVILAFASYFAIEKPFLRLGARFHRREPKGA